MSDLLDEKLAPISTLLRNINQSIIERIDENLEIKLEINDVHEKLVSRFDEVEKKIDAMKEGILYSVNSFLKQGGKGVME